MAETTSPWIIDVAEPDFTRDVIEASHERPVVVDFWAPWCGPCRQLGPVLERLAQERAGDFVLAKVNVDEAQQLAIEFGIEGIPAVKAFRNGRVVLDFVGLLPEAQLRAFFDRVCPSSRDRDAVAAAAFEIEQPAEAETRYRKILDDERDHPAALVGLARLLLQRGDAGAAKELLQRVPPGTEQAAEVDRLIGILDLRELAEGLPSEAELRRRTEDVTAGYQLGCFLAAAGHYPEALDQLLQVAERDKTLGRTKVRDTMVKIFHVVGMRSDLADDYRAKLQRLLY
jgi:putative thioredoxin